MKLIEVPVPREISQMIKISYDDEHISRIIENMYEVCKELIWMAPDEENELWSRYGMYAKLRIDSVNYGVHAKHELINFTLSSYGPSSHCQGLLLQT